MAKLKYASPEFSDKLNAIAQRIVTRVRRSGQKLSFDTISLIGLLTTLLPLLFKLPCFNQPTPAETREALQKAMATEKGAERTLRQVAAKAKRTAKRRNHVTITNEDARVLAQAAIDEALSTDGETLAQYARACANVVDDE